MMYIKVVSVHLVTQLGYNVLFQDVDVVWFEDPVKWIMSGSADGDAGGFDAYFTDDGARSARYAPWSANSGLYYLRAGPRTQYLITSLLYAGDNILSSHSHQQALTSVLAEHSSLYGLSIKIVSREDFPGGKSYHHDKPYMKKWMEGELEPRAFHMCWTLNKDDKILYLQQLGLWFLGVDAKDLVRDGAGEGTCLSEATVECWYPDKASDKRCKGQDHKLGTKDKNKPTFW